MEGDEEYLCCAGAALAWRCGDCGRVSEGFAFPYGLCPACGGPLTIREDSPAEGAAALVAVREAFQIELGGLAFYSQAEREATDPALQDLFERLARMEAEHAATLSRRYHVAEPPAPALEIGRAAPLAGLAYRPEDPSSLFEIALALEARAARFFDERGADTPAGSAERRLYQELAAEEREHLELLTTELARYRQSKPGLL